MGQAYIERADAGDAFETATDLTSEPFTVVWGTMEVDNGDVDVYRIYIADPQAFSATTTNGVPRGEDDTRLFLFDEAGHGIYFNDDVPPAYRSTLPAGHPASPTTPGIYFLAVTHYSIGAFVAPGEPMFCEVDYDPFRCSFTQVYPPLDPKSVFGLWAHTRSDPTTTVAGAEYVIEITGLGMAVASEPSVSDAQLLRVTGANPFQTSTTLSLRTAAPEQVRVVLLDPLGREVAWLHDGTVMGEQRIVVNGGALPPGTYWVRASGETFETTRSLTLVR